MNNTFGKIVLKSFEPIQDEYNELEDGNKFDVNSDEFAFLNSTAPNHFDASQLFAKGQGKSVINPKWTSNESLAFDFAETSSYPDRRSLNSKFLNDVNSNLSNKRNKSLFARSTYAPTEYSRDFGKTSSLPFGSNTSNNLESGENESDIYNNNLRAEAEEISSKQFVPARVLQQQYSGSGVQSHPVKVTLIRNSAQPKNESSNADEQAGEQATFQQASNQQTTFKQQVLNTQGPKLVNF